MPINARIKMVGRFIYRASLCQAKCQTDTADGKGNEPCDYALGQRSRDGSPRAAHLALYGGNCRNTGGVEQHEYQKYDRGKRRKQGADAGYLTAKQQGQRGYNAFLCGKAGNQGGGHTPVRKTERCEQRCKNAAQRSQQAAFRHRHHIKACIEGLQEPDYDRSSKDDGKCLLDKALCLFPDKVHNTFGTGQTVIRQLHNERNRFALEAGDLQNDRIQDAAENAEQIQANHGKRTIPPGEKGADHHGVDGQLGRAALRT